jgi:hypothetical protein
MASPPREDERPELGNPLLHRPRVDRAPAITRRSCGGQLRPEARGSMPASSGAGDRRPGPTRRRTSLAFGSGMPRDEIQGLYFLLGLLLAFYFLMPFLELTTFR